LQVLKIKERSGEAKKPGMKNLLLEKLSIKLKKRREASGDDLSIPQAHPMRNIVATL